MDNYSQSEFNLYKIFCEIINNCKLFCNISLRVSVVNLIINNNSTKMKVVSRAILTILFSCSCLILSSQVNRNRSIGLQLNPYLDENLFSRSFIKPVFAFRYSVGIKDHFSLGPEISGNAFKSTSTSNRSNTLKAGGFVRYSFMPDKRIKPFIELSTYYAFYSWKYGPEGYLTGIEPSGSGSYFSGYLAPGISLYSKSKRFSVDLLYKFSDRDFVNAKHSVFSYRLNYNF